MRKLYLFILCLFVLVSTAAVLQCQLASHPWPMFRHDLSHTGQSGYAGSHLGTLEWSYETGQQIDSSPAVGPDANIRFGSLDDTVYCLNSSGTLVWSFQTGWNVNSSPAVTSGDAVVIGSQDHAVYAINKTGSLRWSFQTGWIVESSPAIGTDDTVYIGSNDKRVYALNGADGALKWTYLTGNAIGISSPAVGTDGRIYICSSDLRFYSLNSNGTLAWSYWTGTEGSSSAAVGTDNRIYTGSSFNRMLYAFNHSGSLAWSFQTGGDLADSSPALTTDGRIYIGCEDLHLYALNTAGGFLWSYRANFEIDSSPAVGSDGLIYVGSLGKDLFALNPDGTLSWSYETGAGIYSSPAIDAYGRTIVGSRDRTLYVFGNTPAPVPPTPTPIPNYVQVSAYPEQEHPGGTVSVDYSCDVSDWGYAGVKVNVYIAVIKDPKVINGPSSVRDALSGSMVYIFNRGMKGAYRYTGTLREPTYSNIKFPPTPLDGSFPLHIPPSSSYAGEWVVGACFVRSDNGRFVRLDGSPVENSNLITVE